MPEEKLHANLPDQSNVKPVENSYSLYQLRDGLENHMLRYVSMDELQAQALAFRERVHAATEENATHLFDSKKQAEAWLRGEGFDITETPEPDWILVGDDMRHESSIHLTYGDQCCLIDGCDTHALDTLVDRAHYDLVYEGQAPAECAGMTNTELILNSIYYQLNMNHPADYRAASMSAGDVIALRQGDQVICYYTDRIGFRQLDRFLEKENALRNAEMSMEDDYDMLDGIINNGPRRDDAAESLSVVNRLKEYRESSAYTEPHAPHPGKEHEL